MVMHYMMTPYSVKVGFRKWWNQGEKAVGEELSQLYFKNTFTPVAVEELSSGQNINPFVRLCFQMRRWMGKAKDVLVRREKITKYTFERRCVLANRLHRICTPNKCNRYHREERRRNPGHPWSIFNNINRREGAHDIRRKNIRVNGLNGTKSIPCLRDCWEKR